jgi:hypothetical protein
MYHTHVSFYKKIVCCGGWLSSQPLTISTGYCAIFRSFLAADLSVSLCPVLYLVRAVKNGPRITTQLCRLPLSCVPSVVVCICQRLSDESSFSLRQDLAIVAINYGYTYQQK